MLAEHWDIMEEQAERYGTPVSRDQWRMVGPMYIAETEEQAYADVEQGIQEWAYYMKDVSTLPILPASGLVDGSWAKTLVASGFAIIGTPQMAIAQIERLYEQAGGFGTYLLWAHEWANRVNTLKSYELFANEVIPHFTGSTEWMIKAEEYAIQRRPDLTPGVAAAREKARQQFADERAADPNYKPKSGE